MNFKLVIVPINFLYKNSLISETTYQQVLSINITFEHNFFVLMEYGKSVVTEMSEQKGFELANVELQYKQFPMLRRDDVEKIRKWLKTQPHLPQITG